MPWAFGFLSQAEGGPAARSLAWTSPTRPTRPRGLALLTGALRIAGLVPAPCQAHSMLAAGDRRPGGKETRRAGDTATRQSGTRPPGREGAGTGAQPCTPAPETDGPGARCHLVQPRQPPSSGPRRAGRPGRRVPTGSSGPRPAGRPGRRVPAGSSGPRRVGRPGRRVPTRSCLCADRPPASPGEDEGCEDTCSKSGLCVVPSPVGASPTRTRGTLLPTTYWDRLPGGAARGQVSRAP